MNDQVFASGIHIEFGDGASDGASVLSCEEITREFRQALNEMDHFLLTEPASPFLSAAASLVRYGRMMLDIFEKQQEEKPAVRLTGEDLEQIICALREQLKIVRDEQFGASSEKNVGAWDGPLPGMENKEACEQETACEADDKPEAVFAAQGGETSCGGESRPRRSKTKGKHRKKHGAAAFPENIAREEVIHLLPDDERFCPECGSVLQLIGASDARERIGISILFKVVVHKAGLYKCPNCNGEGDGEHEVLKKADIPPAAIPGSFAEPSLLAELIWRKYGLGLPYYRIENDCELMGCPLSRQTMTGWAIRCAHMLEPLYERLLHHILQAHSVNADETRLHVIKEEGRAGKAAGYLWACMTGKDEPHQALYAFYAPDRWHCRAGEMLDGFSGILHADAYKAYRDIAGSLLLVNCMAHGRRHFVKLVKLLDPESRSDPSHPAVQAVAFCDRLFELERSFADLTPEERFAARLDKSLPVLEAFYAWLAAHENADGKFGEAVRYMLNNWDYLTNFLLDGHADLSNNRMERQLRGLATGRKNWLFAYPCDGAGAISVHYSLLQTAVLNGVNPRLYMQWLLENVRKIEDVSGEYLDMFMPWNAPSEFHVERTEKEEILCAA